VLSELTSKEDRETELGMGRFGGSKRFYRHNIQTPWSQLSE
jgi:hypothetical protein